MFRKASSVEALGLDKEFLLHQARRMAEMIAACRDDAALRVADVFGPRKGGAQATVHPLSILLSLDDTSPCYESNLSGLVDHFPSSRTAEYAELRLIAMEAAVSRRIVRFRDASQRLAGRPAGAEALFWLANVLQEDSVMDETRTVLSELIRSYPESCWAAESKDRLASISLAERTTA